MAEIVAGAVGALVAGRLALDYWERRLHVQACADAHVCAQGQYDGTMMKPVPPQRRWADSHDYSRYANDPTVRKGRVVDSQLLGIDRDREVVSHPPIDTIPIEPDLFWRQRRRAHYPITRDEREAVPLSTDNHVAYGQQDNTDMFKDDMRARSMAHAPRQQDLRWDDVSRPPRAAELWVPDGHLLQPTTAWKHGRRFYGPADIERSFETRRAPVDLASTAQERFVRENVIKTQRREPPGMVRRRDLSSGFSTL